MFRNKEGGGGEKEGNNKEKNIIKLAEEET